MKTLDRYLAREVLGATLLVLTGLVMLFAFFDLIKEIGDLGKGGYTLTKILGFVLLSTPGRAYELLPIAALIGTLFALAQLVANSELTVMRTAGVSVAQLARALIKGGVAIVLLTIVFGELLAPVSEKAAQQLKIRATSLIVAQEFRSGLWMKDGTNFINIGEMLPDTTLLGVKMYSFDEGYRLRAIRYAEKGQFTQDNQWELRNVTETTFDDKGSHVGLAASQTWKSAITPDLLGVLLVSPEQMSAGDLYSYIRHLRENRQATARYEIALWGKLLYPFASWVMMLLALPFAMFHVRTAGISSKVFAGIMLGLSFHVLNQVFAHLGQIQSWPAFLSAAAPPLIFLGVAAGLMAWREKR